MKTRHEIAGAAGLIIATAALFSGGLAAGSHIDRGEGAPVADNSTKRDFMFQVTGVRTPNQGGHTVNLYFHYRYNDGIADDQIPDYRKLRRQALEYLDAVDVSRNPYWEVLNHHLCTQLKSNFPLQGISCVMQVVGVENPGPLDEPGYRSSIETIGDIEPLVIAGPAGR